MGSIMARAPAKPLLWLRCQQARTIRAWGQFWGGTKLSVSVPLGPCSILSQPRQKPEV